MSQIGEFYGEATDTRKLQTEYGDYPIEITYNYWSADRATSGRPEECVTQRFTLPSTKMGQYSLYEWLCKKMAEACALEEEGFVAVETFDDAIIWSRPADN